MLISLSHFHLMKPRWLKFTNPDDTNVDCVDCNNCLWCIGCKNCTNCQSTDYSFRKAVLNIYKYTNCKYCEGCYDCNECEGCYDCITCDGCDSCNNCQNCVDCIDCVNCTNCVNCKGLNGYKNTNNLTINNNTTEKNDIERLLHKEEEEEKEHQLLKVINGYEDYIFFLDLSKKKECGRRCCELKRCDMKYKDWWFGYAIQDKIYKPYKINKNINKKQASQLINEVMHYNEFPSNVNDYFLL